MYYYCAYSFIIDLHFINKINEFAMDSVHYLFKYLLFLDIRAIIFNNYVTNLLQYNSSMKNSTHHLSLD